VNFGFYSTYVALWVLVIFQGFLIIALLQRLEKIRHLIERGSSLPIGSSAPEFSGVDQFDRETGLGSLDYRGGIILFLSPECPACMALADSLGPLAGELPPTIAVCQGEREACAALSKHFGPSVQVLNDQSGETAGLYGASGFPRAVVVDGKRKIRGYSFPRTVDDLKRVFSESLVEVATVDAVPHVS